MREVVTMQKLVEAGDASNVAILSGVRCHFGCKTKLDALKGKRAPGRSEVQPGKDIAKWLAALDVKGW